MHGKTLLIVLVVCAGCSKLSHDETGAGASGVGETIAAGANQNPHDAVKVQILNYDGIESLIASKRGKVVVVDVWSTGCPPCIKNFPDLVALQKRIGPEQLACISVSLDFEGIGKPEDRLPDVRKFLERQGATFDNVLASEEPTAIYKKLEIPSLPAVFVFDRKGNPRRRFLNAEKAGESEYQEVGRLVDENSRRRQAEIETTNRAFVRLKSFHFGRQVTSSARSLRPGP